MVGMGGVGGVVGRHVCLKKSDFFFLLIFLFILADWDVTSIVTHFFHDFQSVFSGYSCNLCQFYCWSY